jgi:RNA polymerase sigma factor (sigma-70 family)
MQALKNRALDAKRKHKTRGRFIDRLINYVQATPPPPHPLNALSTREEVGALETAIARLREPHRTVVKLKLGGDNYEEIAKLVGLKATRCRQIYYEAKKTIRRTLAWRGIFPED